MFVALLWALLVVQAHADDQPITEQQPANSRTPEGKPWKWPETKTINEPTFIFHLLKHKLKAHMIEKIPTTQTTPVPSNCICVPYYQCNANNTIITDGIGAIDVRYVNFLFIFLLSIFHFFIHFFSFNFTIFSLTFF